jgi:carbon monoxide dehydrogenase subunit G
MKVEQSFVIAQPPERVWGFFEDVPGVARCVPGVESVQVVDADESNIRVRQSLGPMSATFDLRMRVTERVPLDRMQFTAIGKAVKGAAGNLRSVNTVTLAPEGEGTKVHLESDVALGGMLGSVGQKVISKQATGVTQEFASALERALSGEAPAADGTPVTAPSAWAPASPRPAPAGAPPGAWRADPRVTGLAGLCLGLFVAVIVAVVMGKDWSA